VATIELTLKRTQNLSFEVPVNFPYREFFKAGKERHGDNYLVKISHPRKRRTTGELSQNHRIAFLCNIIAAENAYEGYTTYQAVKDLAKLRAIKRGYPYRWSTAWIDGKEIPIVCPKHEDELDTIEASYLIDELEMMAAEKGIDIDIIEALKK
jgi:hypothetical protein